VDLPARNFGEDGARLTYASYLHIAALLDQQEPLTEPRAHDELLFITVHQVYELWFKLLLHELSAARDCMLAGQLWSALHLMKRSAVIERVLVDQIPVLETMTPQDFLDFRSTLAPASGFQSVQFREIEFLSGAKDPAVLARLRGATALERERLERRLEEQTLWDGFVATVAARGLGAETAERLTESLKTIAHDRDAHGDLWELAEALLVHDELSAEWRYRHVEMVERQIGTKSGTGGSSGAPYLRSRLGLRYFPILWELRSVL
jgi:tryptophan 2,3-dioxygenase